MMRMCCFHDESDFVPHASASGDCSGLAETSGLALSQIESTGTWQMADLTMTMVLSDSYEIDVTKEAGTAWELVRGIYL